ncbi:MAG: T9SS type A sorting domain-containing protein [Bacteriovoracaceae bacterium]|nr:T9SS type A sorting domain-containing protein [Bacteroidota bacterium]
MKQRLLFGVVCAMWTMSLLMAQDPKSFTIPELNQVPLDSLLKMDTLQSSASTKLDDTAPVISNDTIKVVGVVLVKPRVLSYTLARYNIFIQDTTTGQVYAGLNILTNDTSSQAQSTLITAVDTGMVIELVGRALEFGNQPNSLTEMYIYSTSAPAFTSPVAVNILDVKSTRPEPVEVTVDSFAVGTSPRPSRGEKYEGMYVILRNITVNSVDLATGRFTFVDANGNQMSMYDGSQYYTLRGHKLSASKYTPPPIGTTLKYIRGIVLPQARTGTAGEYTIMPLYPGPKEIKNSPYPGDISIDKFAPSITNLLRAPGVPKSADDVSVTFKAANLNAGGTIDSAALFYKVGKSVSWTSSILTLAVGDSLYRGTIPKQPNDSMVSYYAGAYASGGLFGTFPDPTIPNFYVIRDGGLKIYDVQFTPYTNGRSGFALESITVSGTITADTSDLKETSGGRPRLFMAGASGAWNGIVIYGNTAGVGIDTLKQGDSITVTGLVLETNSRTVIQVLSRVYHASGSTVPAATVVSMSGNGSLSYELSNPPVDGNAAFEKWESVLIQVNNSYVVKRNADNLLDGASSNFGEYFISSTALPGSSSRFGLRVDDNGTNSFYADTSSAYTAKPSNAQLMVLNSKISSLKGILDYSFSFYKLEPRKDNDFGTITSVSKIEGYVPNNFALAQNFPNPFNPTTNIEYSIPFSGKVSLSIYNVLGQTVTTLVEQELAAGKYVAQFNASRFASGVYFYKLQVGDFVSVKKMMLLK